MEGSSFTGDPEECVELVSGDYCTILLRTPNGMLIKALVCFHGFPHLRNMKRRHFPKAFNRRDNFLYSVEI